MTYGLLDRPLNVTAPAALSELSSLLHDETCSVDDMIYDQVGRTLLFPYVDSSMAAKRLWSA